MVRRIPKFKLIVVQICRRGLLSTQMRRRNKFLSCKKEGDLRYQKLCNIEGYAVTNYDLLQIACKQELTLFNESFDTVKDGKSFPKFLILILVFFAR